MKRVLIISPHFPPVNAPDMQRVRMSLPFYKSLGWEPVVLGVDENFVSGFTDDLLNETIPPDAEIHKLKAWPIKISRLFGLGSVSIRSFYYYLKKGSALLKEKKFDLVFFSTSNFHVCTLGRYWKQKFGVPFIIDMQDPWRNDFSMTHSQKNPVKFKIDYLLHKMLEAYTMPYADGLMSVSQNYIDVLHKRYPVLVSKPSAVLPFGMSEEDFALVKKKRIPPVISKEEKKINVIYIGALNTFFYPIIRAFFKAFKSCIKEKEQYHFYFIGTNYAKGIQHKAIEKMASKLNMQHLVTEECDRIPYFSALSTLMHADIIFIPGLINASYNASKVFNNLYAGTPVFSVFNEKSPLKEAINSVNAGIFVGVHENDTEEEMVEKIKKHMQSFASLHLFNAQRHTEYLDNFMASSLTAKQTSLFNQVISSRQTTDKSLEVYS